jgi:hypothetical protein
VECRLRCRGTVKAHRCCARGVAPPERPSPLRVCSDLDNNKLTGSVPSTLSALTNLGALCVPPSCQRRFCACSRGGSGLVGSAPSARHVGGCIFGASSMGVAAAGLLQCSQRGPLARDVTTEYSSGTPPLVTVRGYRKGTSLQWVRRSTAERPSPLRVCSDLTHNALTGSVPSSLSALTNLALLCVPPSCQRRLHVQPRRAGSVGSAPSSAACRGAACRAHRAGRCGSRAVAVLSEGTVARDVTKEYSRGTPHMGTVRGYRRGTSLPWVRRSTAEWPSPLRVCSFLSYNALTGSVPSSLSALTNLALLCVPPSSRSACACG